MQVYFLGSTDHKGTYYFYAEQHRAWVVADLDLESVRLHEHLFVVLVPTYSDLDGELEKGGIGLGQDGNKWLVDGEDMMLLARDHPPEDYEVLAYNDRDGKIHSGKHAAVALEALGGILAKFKQHFEGK